MCFLHSSMVKNRFNEKLIYCGRTALRRRLDIALAFQNTAKPLMNCV
jgi:hypothetical protein